MADPTPKVELSLVDPGLTPVWRDISAFVLEDGIQTSRGRNSELDRYETGTATILLDNADGRFDPTFAGDLQNLVLNPSVEVDTTDYTAIASTVTRAAAAAQVGAFGLVVATTNVSQSGLTYGSPTTLPVTVGLSYAFSVALRQAVAGAKALNLTIAWYSAADALLSSSNTPISLSSTTSARFAAVAVAPASAHHARLSVWTNGAQGVFTFHADALQFEQAAAATAYNDGDQSNGRWEGTPNASRSFRGGPYYPNLRPFNRVRVSAVWAGTTYGLIAGYTSGWTPQYPDSGRVAVLPVQLQDAFAVLAAKQVIQVSPWTDQADANYLANPSAEDDAIDQYAANAGTLNQSTTRARFGLNSVQLTTTNVDNSHVRYQQDFNLSVIPGRTYTASLYAALGAGGPKDFNFRIDFYNGPTFVNTVGVNVTVPGTDWVRFFVAGAAGAGTDRAAIILSTRGPQGIFDLYTDAWMFEQLDANLGELPAERSDLRIGRILDAVGWPAAARALSPGSSVLVEQEGLRSSALEALQLIEQSENGRLFIDPAGALKYLARWDLGQPPYTVSQATFGPTAPDLPYVEVIPSFDLTFLHNEIRLTGTEPEAVEQVARDPVSAGHYYGQPLELSGLLVTDNELFDAAAYLRDRYGTVQLRFLTLRTEGRGNPAALWPQLLGRALSDRITLRFTPPGRTGTLVQECFIERIAHDWTRTDWQTTYTLSAFGIGQLLYPAGKTFFILGDATNGQIGAAGPGVTVY